MNKKRRNFTAEEKVKILREYLEDGKSAADICEMYRIHPTQLSEWKRIFFQNGASVFEKPQNHQKEQKKLQRIEDQLKDRNEVIAELLQENIKLKKSVGAG
jgi:transposase-like protein